jgi:hypothetical protein
MKKLQSNEIAPQDALEARTGDAARSGGPAVPVARHPGLRAVEAVIRELTWVLKETDPVRGRRASLSATPLIALPDADALRGKKVLEGARSGHEARYGTTEEKLARLTGYQAFIDAAHARRPGRSYEALVEDACKHFGCSAKTIKRHTKNPRKLA